MAPPFHTKINTAFMHVLIISKHIRAALLYLGGRVSYPAPPAPPPPPQAGENGLFQAFTLRSLNHDKRENNFRNTLPPLQSTPSCSSEDATSPSPHSSGPHPCALPDFSRLTHGFTFRLGPARRPSVMARPRRCCSCSPSAAFGRRSFLFRSLFPLLPSCFL